MHEHGNKEIAAADLHFLAGEGEMRRRIREFDWTRTALGAPSGWPTGLRLALEIMLNCGTAAYIAWGPTFIQFYNDAYISILGDSKHPHALGASTSETWSEIWDFVGPSFESVLVSKHALAMADKLLLMQRKGYLEECYFSFSYNPLLDDDGRSNGILTVALETTNGYVSYRRANALRMLAQGLSEVENLDGIRSAFERTVLANQQDLPFGMWYEIREGHAALELVAAAGIERGSALCPERIDARHGNALQGLMNLSEPVVRICSIAPEAVQWMRQELPLAVPRSIIIKPLCYSNYQRPDSYVVLAINPMRPNDIAQQDFLQMVRLHLENAIRRVSRAEVEKREYEHQFHNIMSVMPCIVWMFDVNGTCYFVNRMWSEYTGLPAQLAMGMSWMDAIHPDDLDDIRHSITIQRDVPLNLEYRLRDTKGHYRWILDKLTPKYGGGGEFLGYTGTAIDITERKEAEQRMQTSQAELRILYNQLQTAREEERCALAREVHDQLGQILSAAKIDIKLLEECVRSSDGHLPRDNFVTELQSASSSLQKALDVVRRLATELRPPELESQGLSAALRWHALDFERRTRIRCNVRLDPDIPDLDVRNATALFGIFQESMTNILRHASASEVWISLDCRLKQVLLRVRDNGVGISKRSAQSAGSIGLKGMRERALLEGGRLVVGPLRPCGTIVAARLPRQRCSGHQIIS